MLEKLDSQKKIILFTVAFFVLASGWLFWVSDRHSSSDVKQNWWTIYFAEPKTNSLDFVVENHGDGVYFHWEIWRGNEKQSEGDEKINKGEAKKIEIGGNDRSEKKASVKVSAGGERQEIYKNLTK